MRSSELFECLNKWSILQRTYHYSPYI